VRGLYDELLPHFSSRMFNVGCDETFDLGQGRSEAACRTLGRSCVYLDFLLKIHRVVRAHGRTMQYWGDIIIQHPELIGELPPDAVALAWGYEANHPFDAHGEKFAAAGIPFYVCPGTGSWRTLAGRTSSVLDNLRNAAANGMKHGAIGYLNTDWGDEGHWQPLPVSYLGFAYGAAASWTCDAARGLDLAPALSRYAFGDPTGTLGRIAFNLGDIHRGTGVAVFNATVFFQVLHEPAHRIAEIEGLNEAGLCTALDAIDEVMARWPQARSGRADAHLVQREYAWVADMMRHACRRGLWALAGARKHSPASAGLTADADRLILEYRDLWLARSRPGGLADSAGRLERMRQDYLRD
jgi:hexosaminidase